jgi:hypothetical protein
LEYRDARWSVQLVFENFSFFSFSGQRRQERDGMKEKGQRVSSSRKGLHGF